MTWLMFMYRNPMQLQKLARRNESRWAKFNKPVPGELVAKARRPYSDDRYIAVNCNNRATYELRFFRSTLNEREFYAAIEFADASVRYTRAIKTSDVLRGNALDWSQFVAWLQSDGGYPNLLAEASK